MVDSCKTIKVFTWNHEISPRKLQHIQRREGEKLSSKSISQ